MCGCPDGEKVLLFFRTLSGNCFGVEVGVHEQFGHLKKRLELEVGIVASRIRLICRGHVLPNTQTPTSYGLAGETVLHVVLDQVSWFDHLPRPCFPHGAQPACLGHFHQVNLDEVIKPEKLKANCPKCETSGAVYDPRPFCTRCG